MTTPHEQAVAQAVLSGEAAPSESMQQHLTFMLGGEMFAMGILDIREILEYATPTEVPMMPAYLRGVINLRGAVVPVVDMLARFGRPSTPVTKRTCIVIVELVLGGEPQTVGLVVDAVNEVLDIPADDIDPPPAFGARIQSDFIRGMGKVHGKLVILLDVNHILAADERVALAGSELAS
jgi:purine-binding chemotaxis protein CheW